MKMKKLFLLISLVMLAFSVTSMTLAAFGENVTVEFYSSFDNGNKNISHGTQSKNIGDSLSLDASLYSAHEFAFWVINGVVRDDLNATSSIRVQSTMIIHAVFSKTGENAVLFIDSNGRLISSTYVLDGGEVTPPSYAGYSKPGLTVNTSEPWKTYEGTVTYNNIDSSRVYVLQYTANPYPVTITLTGATVASISANRNDVVTVTAANVVDFKYWKDENGKVLSYKPSFTFTAAKDTTIIAETKTEQSATPLVVMTDDLAVREDYETFIAQFELLPGQELVEHGFLLSETEVAALTVDSAGVVVAKSNNYNPITNEFIMSFAEVTFVTIRAYIAVLDGSEVEYYYSESNAVYATDLFISEYIEGGSNNKALEIYNGTGAPVDLTPYSIVTYTNGGTVPQYTLSLTGTLDHGDVYVIVNSGSISGILSVKDIESTVTYFNGDDAVALKKNGVNIDVFGVIGEDLGSNWPIGTGSTENHTIVRKSEVVGPTDSWNKDEWSVYAQDTIEYLGSHVFGNVILTDKQGVILDSNNIEISSSVKTSGDMLLPETGSHGTTITWSSDTPLVISDEGIVSLPTPSPVVVILTATVTKGTVVKDVEFEVAVGLEDSDRTAADRDAIVVPGAVTVAGDMELPESGINGSLIAWESDTPATISHEGIVVLPGSGTVSVILTATISYGSSSIEKEFTVVVGSEAQSKVVLRQSDFGETNGWQVYTLRSNQVVENGTDDSSPTGNSIWDILGGNVNNSGWDYIRVGGKAASVENPATVYLKTNFTFDKSVTEIVVSIVNLDSASGNEKIYLQTSADNSTWVTVTSKTTVVGDLTFDSLNIASGTYFRFVFERASTGSNNGGTDVKTITFYGLE